VTVIVARLDGDREFERAAAFRYVSRVYWSVQDQ
jgi:hypothetical protein